MASRLRVWLPASWGVLGAAALVAALPPADVSRREQAPATAALAPVAAAVPPASAAAAGGEASASPAPGAAGSPGDAVAAGGRSPSRGAGAAPAEAPGLRAPGAPVAVRCVGNPPRQTFAVYSAPCAGPFDGDNGGATAPGVTAGEVRVTVLGDDTSYQGLVPTSPQAGETAADRTYRVLQEWFNRSYQFYGRRLQLVSLAADGSVEQQQAAVIRAKEEFGSFGLVFNSGPAAEIGPDRGLVTFSSYRYPRSVYAERAPFLWTHGMDNTLTIELGAEYLCRKLAGRPAEFTDDPQLRPPLAPVRRFGVLYFAGDDFARNGPDFVSAARAECGLDVVAAGYDVNDPSSMGTAVTRLRQEGVTTAVFLTEFVTGGRALSVATGQGWFPEWIVLGFGGADNNTLAASLPQEQWRNAFGVTSAEIPVADAATDWWRAYREVDPGGTPDAAAATFLWPHLTQLANGIQMAGPQLSPETFRDGLYAMGYTRPRARWATGGGYGPGDPSYVDFVAEIWWDPTALAYRFTREGARYGRGEIDRDTSELFRSGITEAPAS